MSTSMKLYVYTIQVVRPEEDNDPNNLLIYKPSIALQSIRTAQGTRVGFDLGKVSEGDPHPDKNLIFVENGVAHKEYQFLSVSEPNDYGYRTISIPEEDAAISEEQALIFLDGRDPYTELRFMQSKTLHRDGLLMEGRHQDTRSDSKFYSCPGLLVAQHGEEYTFSFFSKKSHKAYIISFHWDYDIIITQVEQRMFKQQNNYNKSEDPNRKWGSTLFSLNDYASDRRQHKEDRRRKKKY